MVFDVDGFKVSIRKCRKSDYGFVFKVTKATLFKYISKYRKLDLKKFRDDFYESCKDTVILMSKGRRIGLFQLDKKKNCLEIVKIVISPAYHGRGIGWFLMKYFETLGFSKICLQVWENNPAYHFYKELGYKVIRKINHKIHMEKTIIKS
ncbi:MAG: GNAT family N-acetyltransferase [Nanoarchaeota archaeon]